MIFAGEEKYTCPDCGTSDVELFSDRVITTPAGTIQRVMVCKDSRVQYKISNQNYLKFLKYKNIL